MLYKHHQLSPAGAKLRGKRLVSTSLGPQKSLPAALLGRGFSSDPLSTLLLFRDGGSHLQPTPQRREFREEKNSKIIDHGSRWERDLSRVGGGPYVRRTLTSATATAMVCRFNVKAGPVVSNPKRTQAEHPEAHIHQVPEPSLHVSSNTPLILPGCLSKNYFETLERENKQLKRENEDLRAKLRRSHNLLRQLLEPTDLRASEASPPADDIAEVRRMPLHY